MAELAERDASRPDAISRAFGDRVRALRERSNMTLEQFSKLSGVSKAMLSKVERAEKSPTIGIAKRIAHALNAPLSVLMGDELAPRRTFVQLKKAERQVFRDPKTGFERHLLSPIMAGMPVEVAQHFLPPRTTTGMLPAYPRGVGKHVVASRGQVVVGTTEKEVVLNEGDSLFFDADIEHWFENRSDMPSEYYLIISTDGSIRNGALAETTS